MLSLVMDQGPLSQRVVARFDNLSAQLQVAARYVLDHPRDVALLSMREQARKAGVRPATMTRFAKQLGLSGYDDIRELYANAMRGGNLDFANKVDAQVTSQKLRGDRALATGMLKSVMGQLARLAQPDALERLVAAADHLVAARRIYCLGLRSSHPVAWHAHYILSFFGDRSVFLDAGAGTGADQLRDATRQDVLLVTSVAPYTRATVETAQYAASLGVKIVAITDSEVAPLAQLAKCAILVPTASQSFFHTMAPAFVMVEILAALVAGRGGKAALNTVKRMEKQLIALDVHLSPRGARPDPMSHILHRRIHQTLPQAVAGTGIEIIGSDGRIYIDASGGAAVSCLGHGHPDVLAAMQAQLEKIAYAHTSFFTTDVAEHLADRLVADAPQGLDHVYLVSGGSEAVEAALKMARQYFVEKGEPQRRHIIARRQSYHGNTLGALAAGGNEWRRRAVLTAADRDASYRSLLRLSVPGGGRKRREPMRQRLGRSARAQDPGAWTRQRHGLHRRDRCRRDSRARSRRWPIISSAFAPSAIAMACCSSSMR